MVSVIIVIEKLLSALLQRARTSVIRLLSEVVGDADADFGQLFSGIIDLRLHLSIQRFDPSGIF